MVEFRANSVPIGVGAWIAETVRFLGRHYTTIFDVTELEPPRTLALRSTEGPLLTVLLYELEPSDRSSTELRFVLDMDGPRPLGLPVPGFHALMRWYLRNEGRRLARLVAGRAA